MKALRLELGEWVLVVTDNGTPQGWIDVTGVEGLRSGRTLAQSTSAGGSLFSPGGDLRQALDAAISSPSGIGVAVDGEGAVIGGILGSEVVAKLADQRRHEDEERNRVAFTEGFGS